MDRVVLIDPAYGGKNKRPQLGTLNLAAMLLKEGINVELIDFSVRKDGADMLEKVLNQGVICVGISSVIGSMLRGGLDVARLVRKHSPKTPIVWGGVHPSIAAESTLRHELVDSVCVGEGELTFPLMVKAYADGKPLHDIAGIGFKENENLIFTPSRTGFFDLDSLPLLPYHLVDLDSYKIKKKGAGDFFGLLGDQILSVETSRGCIFRCTYCVNASKREPFRKMSPEKVIESLEHIVAQGVKTITINDDNFFIDKKRANRILNLIDEKKWGLEIFVAVRSDYLSSIEDSDYELMKKAGIKMFGIGVESGSEKTLKRINKKEGIEAMFEANKRLAKHKINAWVHFIYGFPGETLDDFLETYKAMKMITKENPYAHVNLNRLIPNPGTPSFQECVESGWTAPSTIEGWANIIEDISRKRPAYIDPDLERWWARHIKGTIFPTNHLPNWFGLILQRWILPHFRGLLGRLSFRRKCEES